MFRKTQSLRIKIVARHERIPINPANIALNSQQHRPKQGKNWQQYNSETSCSGRRIKLRQDSNCRARIARE